MGLFGEKEKCCICQKNEGKKQIIDGRVCWDCIHLAGPYLKNKNTFGYKQNSKQEFYEAITKSLENLDKSQGFSETDSYSNGGVTYIRVDDVHKQWVLPSGNPPEVYFSFSDIIDCELVEDGKTISETKQKGGSGIGRAAVGGMMFGPTGAVVGAVTKKKKAVTKEKEILSTMSVRLILSNKEFPTATIIIAKPPFTEVEKGSGHHENMRRTAEEIIARLSRMKIAACEDQNGIERSGSEADEILKYKQLLDIGAITQEEFEAKKKQLLGL